MNPSRFQVAALGVVTLDDWVEVVRKMIEAARNGDVAAATWLTDVLFADLDDEEEEDERPYGYLNDYEEDE